MNKFKPDVAEQRFDAAVEVFEKETARLGKNGLLPKITS